MCHACEPLFLPYDLRHCTKLKPYFYAYFNRGALSHVGIIGNRNVAVGVSFCDCVCLL